MAVAETAIKALIESDTGSLSSSSAVWAILAPPDSVKPYITYEVIAENPNDVMGTETTPTECLFSVNIFADTFLEVINVAADMRTVFNRYSGTIDSVVVQNIFFEGRNDFFDESDRNYHRVMDFRMHFEE